MLHLQWQLKLEQEMLRVRIRTYLTVMLHHPNGAHGSCGRSDGRRQRRSGYLAVLVPFVHHHPFGANYISTNIRKRVGPTQR